MRFASGTHRYARKRRRPEWAQSARVHPARRKGRAGWCLNRPGVLGLFETRPCRRCNQRARRTRWLRRDRRRTPCATSRGRRVCRRRSRRRGCRVRCGRSRRRGRSRCRGLSRCRGWWWRRSRRRWRGGGRDRGAQGRSSNRGRHEEGADGRNGITAQPQKALHETPPVRRHLGKKAIDGFIHLKKLLLEYAPHLTGSSYCTALLANPSIADLNFLARLPFKLTDPPRSPYYGCQ
jgi:hypothetical protein